MGKLRNAHKILVGNPKGDVNIRMDLKDVVWEGVDWIHMA
jgi:hypothetical protein